MPRPTGIAFLLPQLGAHTAARFAERLADLDLTPEHVAVLRVVAQSPGLSQQALAVRTGALPSRIVRLVDELEGRGLVERRRSPTDRRSHELHPAAGAEPALASVLATVAAHDAEITDGLTADERRTLGELLARLATARGLDTEVHGALARRPGHKQD